MNASGENLAALFCACAQGQRSDARAGKKCFLRLQILGSGAQCHGVSDPSVPRGPPPAREDLLRPSGGPQFFVSEPLPAREIVSRLEGRPSNACPSPCPSLPLHTLTSLILFPFCYFSVVDCLIMRRAPHDILIFCQECRSLLDSSVITSIPECFPVFFSLLRWVHTQQNVCIYHSYRHTHLVSWM